jgi:methionine-rich copper-binding protein CopC
MIRRLLAVAVAATLTLTLFSAGPAGAHAELSSVTPTDGASVNSAPRMVSVTFNEPVTGAAGSVQLLDQNAKVLRRSAVVNGATVELPGKALGAGRYLIRWSITSADGHVVVGATSFQVRTTSAKSKPVTVTLNAPAGTKQPPLTASLSGSKPGVRTFTLNGVSGEATVELRNLTFGAPLLWKLRPQSGVLTATGVIPAAGTWEITVKVRVSAFQQLTYNSKVTVAS